MHIDAWTIFFQTVNVLVLVWLLKRFLFRPIVQMIADRRKVVETELAAAQVEMQRAEAARAEAESEVERQRATRDEAIKAAQEAAVQQAAAIVAEGRAAADRIRAEAQAEALRQRQAEEAALARHATQLAIDIAARLLDRLPDEARIAGFIDGLIDGLARLPQEARARLAADGTIHIKAARALSESETATCTERLTACLGRPVALVVTADTGLIAGLEIDHPYLSVRNSFRADLEAIAHALAQSETQAS